MALDFAEGFVLPIDKPYGMTSFGALARVRGTISRHLGVKRIKIGHAGTLDPLATGVLLLCVGRMTKQIERLQLQKKEYVATLQLGATTPSYDLEHPVDATYPTQHITRQVIASLLESRFTGIIEQVPPTYSACKIEGKRAYKMRRDGEQVELKPKHIHIDSITLTSFDAGKGQMSIDVVCGKGTYIRALARDIGRALNSGAYLTSLRRTRVGDITINDCISFDHFEEWLSSIK